VNTIRIAITEDDWMFLSLLALVAVDATLLWRGRSPLIGSTLIYPWCWSMASIVAVGGCEALVTASHGEVGGTAWAGPIRYLAAVATFCPVMAVLGAKRPQHRAWQWVVVSLWLVLSLPALEAIAFRTGPQVTPPMAWKLMIAVLVSLELLNYLPSRHLWAVVIFAGGQAVLLAPHLAKGVKIGSSLPLVTLAMWCLSLVLVWLRERGERHVSETETDTDRWTRFRDWYGAFWMLRVMSLVNHTAKVSNWPVVLMPGGFVQIHDTGSTIAADTLPTDVRAGINRSLGTTLRRFLAHKDRNS
jgi:hypothetical protein